MDDDNQLSDTIKKLQADLQGLPDSDGDEDVTGGLQDTIKQLEQELGDVEDDTPKFPDVAEISSLISMEEFLKESAHPETMDFYLKLLGRKEKFLGLIREGKVTADAYRQLLEKKKAQNISNEKIAKAVTNELLLLPKFPSLQEWFNKIVTKCMESLPKQQALFSGLEPRASVEPKAQRVQSVRQDQPEARVSQPVQQIPQYKSQQAPKPQPVQPPPKPKQVPRPGGVTQIQAPKQIQFTSQPLPNKPSVAQQFASGPQAMAKQQQLIAKFDKQTPAKKAQIVLKSISKVESLILYYKQNMPDKKAKEINELLPVRQLAIKVVQALLSGKPVPIGDFVMNKIPKLDFEKFHGCTRKDYHNNIETILKKYKLLQRNERDLKKKIGRSQQNSQSMDRCNQVLQSYQSDMQYLGSIRNKDFVPIPSVRLGVEERQNFIQNKDLQKNDLQLIISKIEGLPVNGQLKIYFEQSNNPRTVYEVMDGPCSINLQLKITEQAFENLDKKMVKIKIQGKKMLLFTSVLAYYEIILAPFASQNTMQGVVESHGVKLTYQFNIRYPSGRITKTKVETISMVRHPEYIHTPQFEIDFIKKFINYTDPNVKPVSQPVQSSKTQGQPQPQQPQQPKPQPVPTGPIALFWAERTEDSVIRLRSIRVEGLTQDNVERPQIYCDCVSYLTQMDNILDKAMNQLYSFKPNKRLIEDIQDQIMKRKTIVEASRKQGKLTNEAYAQRVLQGVKNDQVLMEAYRNLGVANLPNFMLARIQLASAELKTLGIVVGQPQPQSQPQQQPQAQVQPQQPQQPQQQKGGNQQLPSSPNVKTYDLSPYPLFFVSRTPQINQVLAALTTPVETVEPSKLKNPESLCFSSKYLAEFEGVLDKTVNDLTVDKANRNLAQDMQDTIMKNKMLIEKKKATMTPDQYKQMVANFIEQDTKLIAAYKKINLVPFQQFLLGRIRVCKLEIGQPPILEIIKNSFDLNEEREVGDIQRTEASNKVLEKLGPQLKNPENPEYCSCVSYIEKMLEVTKNPQLSKELTAAKERFEASFANGSIDEQKYAAMIKKNKEDDIGRLEVYKRLDLKEFYLFIKARLKMIEEELANF